MLLPEQHAFLMIEMCSHRDEASSGDREEGAVGHPLPAEPGGSLHLRKIDDVIPNQDDATRSEWSV